MVDIPKIKWYDIEDRLELEVRPGKGHPRAPLHIKRLCNELMLFNVKINIWRQRYCFPEKIICVLNVEVRKERSIHPSCTRRKTYSRWSNTHVTGAFVWWWSWTRQVSSGGWRLAEHTQDEMTDWGVLLAATLSFVVLTLTVKTLRRKLDYCMKVRMTRYIACNTKDFLISN